MVTIRAQIEKNTLCDKAFVRVRVEKYRKNTLFGRDLVKIRAKIEKNTLSDRALLRIRAEIK